MNKIIINTQRHNQFAAFLRSVKKGYVLNKEKVRVEINNKYFINLN